MHPSLYKILIADDEVQLSKSLQMLLSTEGYRVDTAAGHLDAIASFQMGRYDLAFVDIRLAEESGIQLLKDIKMISPLTQVILMTGFPRVETVADALRHGALDYLVKPISRETLLTATRQALITKKNLEENERYRANLDAIFRNVSEAIVLIDAQGRLREFNAAAAHACGYQPDMLGTELTNLPLDCAGRCRKALLETLNAGNTKVRQRLECHAPAGQMKIINFSASTIMDSDGAVSGAVAVLRDETHLIELEKALQKRGQYHALIGASAPMQHLYALIETLSCVSSTVLITGESGTGKELVAAALHNSSTRAQGPFVKVNCSALSESLLESELFGHVRGAFTGAIADKVGRFELADGGTLFLDEIGDISPAIQMRLLRVLQESEFERVGESASVKVDVRIIAATNQPLEEKIAQGVFRSDLYYRLNVINIEIPPLRERREDLGQLAGHFIANFNRRFGKNISGIAEEVLAAFNACSWPGNVRQLEHVIEHAVALSKSNIIQLTDLPAAFAGQRLPAAMKSAPLDSPPASTRPLDLDEALRLAQGNKARAARMLGISRPTLYKQLRAPKTLPHQH
jgi:PAS domain S-box-containing protein